MAKINIPSQIFTGFKTISELNPNQVESLTTYINNLPLDIEFSDVASKLEEILKITNGKQLLQTFLSFRNLSEENDINNEKLAANLTDSFIELSAEAISVKKKKILKNNLQIILNNYSSLKSIIDARKLLVGNGKNIEEFNINSDIRLLFNEDNEKKKRSAIIFHRMQFEYSEAGNINEIYFSVDIDDLKKLKIEIEKAIKNDQLIREDYKEALNFIF